MKTAFISIAFLLLAGCAKKEAQPKPPVALERGPNDEMMPCKNFSASWTRTFKDGKLVGDERGNDATGCAVPQGIWGPIGMGGLYLAKEARTSGGTTEFTAIKFFDKDGWPESGEQWIQESRALGLTVIEEKDCAADSQPSDGCYKLGVQNSKEPK